MKQLGQNAKTLSRNRTNVVQEGLSTGTEKPLLTNPTIENLVFYNISTFFGILIFHVSPFPSKINVILKNFIQPFLQIIDPAYTFHNSMKPKILRILQI